MIRDKEKIRELLDTAVKELPKAVSDYKNGKKSAIKSIIGRAMAISKGRADPVILNDEAEKIL